MCIRDREEALLEARRINEERQSAGFDQVALEAAARLGLSNGAFEESEDEGTEVVEEFFPAATESAPGSLVTSPSPEMTKVSLTQKLAARSDASKDGSSLPDQRVEEEQSV